MIVEFPKEKSFLVGTEERGTYSERYTYTVKARTEKEAISIVKGRTDNKRITDMQCDECDMDIQKTIITSLEEVQS